MTIDTAFYQPFSLPDRYKLKYKWTTSKARDSYGYNRCTLLVNGKKEASTCGGGYDMIGTCLGSWAEKQFSSELLKLKKEFYGLTYHDPNWKPSDQCLEIEKNDELSKLTGLAQYQDFYKQSSKVPTDKHIVPLIDGACGVESVKKILSAIGYIYDCIDYDSGVYAVEKHS